MIKKSYQPLTSSISPMLPTIETNCGMVTDDLSFSTNPTGSDKEANWLPAPNGGSLWDAIVWPKDEPPSILPIRKREHGSSPGVKRFHNNAPARVNNGLDGAGNLTSGFPPDNGHRPDSWDGSTSHPADRDLENRCPWAQR